jgi:hypothetical protein
MSGCFHRLIVAAFSEGAPEPCQFQIETGTWRIPLLAVVRFESEVVFAKTHPEHEDQQRSGLLQLK